MAGELSLKTPATGLVTLSPANTATDKTITIPATTGTMVVQDGTNTTTITNLAYTGTLTGGTGVINIGSGQVYKDASGNVGIGTSSPINTFGKSIHLYNDANTGTVASNTFLFVESANRNSVIELSGSASATNAINFSDTPGTAVAGIACSIADQNIFFRTGGTTERMRLDASGNLGLGVTPSAWNTAWKAMQIGSRSSITSGTGIVTDLNYNSYRNTSNIDVYIDSDFATRYRQISGNHLWFTAPSGTAGNAITFTERMVLTSTGSLSVPQVNNDTTAAAANVNMQGDGYFRRSTSALKYKQDIRDLESIDINLFRPVRYKSKCEADDQTKDHIGIIADEVANAGIEELVNRNESGEVEGFQYERLTVVLLKAIQELTARLEVLENK